MCTGLLFSLLLSAAARQEPAAVSITSQAQTPEPQVRVLQSDILAENRSDYSPAQQLYLLSVKYPPKKYEAKQSLFIRATVRRQAQLHGVPVQVALGISGHESGGWTMWPRGRERLSDQAIFNRNYGRSGAVSSTDWGVMQINDVAHPQAFPRARYDVEYNIAFGMDLLARTHAVYKGSLNMGYGAWDKTVAAYHLGHAPRAQEMEHTRRYIQETQSVLKSAGLLTSLHYTVMAGDTLDRIAQKHYGDAGQWERIWHKNQEQLSHPGQIRVGQTLKIPFE